MVNEEMKNINKQQNLTSIVAINKTENKYYIYSENGLLVNRINYESII